MTPDEIERLAKEIAATRTSVGRVHERIDGIEKERAERGETLAVLVKTVGNVEESVAKLLNGEGPIAQNAKDIRKNTDWRLQMEWVIRAVVFLSGGACIAVIAEALHRL